jgi:hypothetical protein
MLVIFGPVPIVKLTALDVSVLVSTVTWAVPGVAIRFANTGAVSCVELMTLVAKLAPFHCTTAPDVNPAPFTVSVKAGPPAVALLGSRELTAGVTLKFTAFEVTAPDARSTAAIPAKASRFAGTVAVN